jgi:5-methylcytosine-specific restriction protein A
MLHLCPEQGCGTLVAEGRCEEHTRSADRSRGTAAERGYDAKWQRFRHWFIGQLIALGIGPFCGARLPGTRETSDSRCQADGVVTEGKHVDHIVPHRGDQVLMYSKFNVQLLCAACHLMKTRSGR